MFLAGFLEPVGSSTPCVAPYLAVTAALQPVSIAPCFATLCRRAADCTSFRNALVPTSFAGSVGFGELAWVSSWIQLPAILAITTATATATATPTAAAYSYSYSYPYHYSYLLPSPTPAPPHPCPCTFFLLLLQLLLLLPPELPL